MGPVIRDGVVLRAPVIPYRNAASFPLVMHHELWSL